ncbi:MAG: oligosaccharide flippase family protein [Clostridiales bacterium]|nr:oligosaccharide flippase family protein [Clostridiales bacterium]
MSKSIKKNYTFNLIARILTLIVPLVVTPYISRTIGADGVGLCSYVASIASYFVLVANLGISSYSLREISMHRHDENYIKKFAVEVAITKAVLTVLCLGVYCGIFVRLDGKVSSYIYILYSITLVEVILDFSWYFQGVERFGLLALFHVIAKIFYVVLIFVFVKSAGDLVAYAAISVLTNSLVPILGTFCMFKLCHGKIEGKLNPIRHIKPCMVYFLPAIATQVYTVVDKTMIGAITKSNAENGYYEFAEKITKLPLTFLTSMNAIMESRIAYYYAQNDIEAAKALTAKSMNFSMMLAFPSTAGLIAIAKTFIPIYLGSGYEKCITLTYIFAPLTSIICFSNLLGSHYYTPFGKRVKSAIFLVCGAVVNVILNSFMILYFQSVGAAIASIVAEAVISALYILFARKFVHPILFAKTAVKYFIAAAIMGVSVYFINAALPHTVWYLLLEVFIGGALYSLLLTVLRTKYFMDTAKSLLTRFFVRRKAKAVAAENSADASASTPESDPVPPLTEDSDSDERN